VRTGYRLDWGNGGAWQNADFFRRCAAGNRRGFRATRAHEYADRTLAWRHCVSREEHDILLSSGYFDSAQRRALDCAVRDWEIQTLGARLWAFGSRLS